MKDPKGRIEPGYVMHAFVCGHSRPENSARPSCSAKGSLELLRNFKTLALEHGLTGIRIQKSGCLDFCEFGPSCVIYPQGEWFTISEESIPSLIEYLDGGLLPTKYSMNICNQTPLDED
ncbi:MAG: (2Fe-2S) ferredoxin domain-containing protein [Candidatus Poseidoniaceae archaeon]|jgi:(2Fe-2S) ferredoxin|nr:(2Fe-2S) ferredoxin domain-containing protein [Candidatus Poseidoniaceae archaeon]